MPSGQPVTKLTCTRRFYRVSPVYRQTRRQTSNRRYQSTSSFYFNLAKLELVAKLCVCLAAVSPRVYTRIRIDCGDTGSMRLDWSDDSFEAAGGSLSLSAGQCYIKGGGGGGFSTCKILGLPRLHSNQIQNENSLDLT